MTSPSAPIRLVLIGSTALTGTPNCDPAIDLSYPGVATLLSAYERSRSDADRDALPLHRDARPVLFTVLPLTAAGLRMATAREGTGRVHDTVSIACHEYTDERGAIVRAADHGGLSQSGKVAIASDDWTDHLIETFGAKALAEIAAVALTRAEVGPRALAPFALPRGLMLAR